MFLSEFLIYKYNDMAMSMVQNMQRYLRQPVQDTFHFEKGDWLINKAMYYISYYIDPVLLINIFVLVSILLNLLFSFKLIKYVTRSSSISAIFALIYAFAPYGLFRISSGTIPLCFTFVIPWVVTLIIKGSASWKVGLAVFFSSLISAYYGFFLAVVVCIWYCMDIAQSVVTKILPSELRKLVSFVFVFGLLTVGFYGNSALANIPIFGKYNNSDNLTQNYSLSVVYRPIEDYYNFAILPWYFLIPPKASLFLSTYSYTAHEFIRNTGYFLAQNYQDDEMGGLFLGWHFIIGLIYVMYLLINNSPKLVGKFREVHLNRLLLLKLVVLMFAIVLLTLPPTITVNGFTLYMPSFIMYKFSPVFRVLTRWASVLFLITLLINAILLSDLISLSKKISVKVVLLGITLILSVLSFSLKLPIIYLKNAPEEVKHLASVANDKYFVVYPRSDFYSTFWILYHKKRLLNVPGFLLTHPELAADGNELILDIDRVKNDESVSTIVFYPHLLTDKDMQYFEDKYKIYTETDILKLLGRTFGDPQQSGSAYLYKIR